MTRSGFPPQLVAQIRRFYGLKSARSPQIKRFHSLVSTFQSDFPESKSLSILRAPGRVNIIGEHTDYNGYPVLPIAIERDIAVAVGPTDDKTIEISNTDTRFGERRFGVTDDILPFERGDWGNYVKAAVQGILSAGLIPVSGARGMRAVFSGTIPPAAGLSSSSALVVASALAFLGANRREADKKLLAELLPKAERYVGTESGGMDQAISLLGEQRKALKIDFFPLRIEPIPIPPGYAFVVCNSLVDASKSGVARAGYNLRVVECRLAAALLAQKLAQKTGRSIRTSLLSDLAPQKVGVDAGTLATLAREVMGEEALTIPEIARRLGEEEKSVVRDHCRLKDGSTLFPPREGFKLWRRYRHVCSEAKRVIDAVDALRKSDIPRLGDLMNASHASCRDDYEVSCPELEELVEIARRHGAIGARLTGAGFGGCTVNLVKEGKTAQFMRGVRKDYYGGNAKNGPMDKWKNGQMGPNPKDLIFPCHPFWGAAVVVETMEL